MKKLSLFIALVLFAGLSAHAADHYILKFRGTITSPDGKIRVKETQLVTTNGNTLVMNVDLSGADFDVFESDPTGVDELQENTHNDTSFALANGHGFATDLHFSAGFAGNVGNVPTFEGRLIGVARISFKKGNPKGFRMPVSGIWNPDDNSTFKGTITGVIVPPAM